MKRSFALAFIVLFFGVNIVIKVVYAIANGGLYVLIPVGVSLFDFLLTPFWHSFAPSPAKQYFDVAAESRASEPGSLL